MTERNYDKESHLRSLLKGITWRITATLATVLIVYLVTGNVSFACQIGAVEAVTKIAVYYLHERLWQLVPRGTIRKLYERR